MAEIFFVVRQNHANRQQKTTQSDMAKRQGNAEPWRQAPMPAHFTQI